MLPSEKLVKALRAFIGRRNERGEQSDLARETGVSQPTLSRLLSASPLPTVSFDVWSRLHSKYPNEIPPPSVAGNDKPFETPKNINHIAVIGKLQNDELAMRINAKLVELEKLSPEALDDVEFYIDVKLRKVRKGKKK